MKVITVYDNREMTTKTLLDKAYLNNYLTEILKDTESVYNHEGVLNLEATINKWLKEQFGKHLKDMPGSRFGHYISIEELEQRSETDIIFTILYKAYLKGDIDSRDHTQMGY